MEVLTAIQFLTPRTGFVGGYGGRIERTDDGGATWHVQRAERDAEVINSLFFADEQHGWAVGAGGLALRTTDGGAQWFRVATGRVEDLWCVRFSSPTRGLVVGDAGLILATDDGGLHWSPRPSRTTRPLLGLALGKAGTVVAVGEAGTILRSADGIAWKTVDSQLSESLNAVGSAEPGVFWAVGARGATTGSRDGGETWVSAERVSTHTLRAIALADGSHGLAVGRQGACQLLR